MDVVFASFAIITTICLAVWGYRRMGCLGAIVLFVGAAWALTFVEKYVNSACQWRDDRLAERAKQAEMQKAREAENARIAEAKRQQAQVAAEAKRRENEKNEKISSFALKEVPKVWAVYQSLQSAIDIQNAKVEELRKTLEAFDKSPSNDVDFVRICDLREEMIRSQTELRRKLEDAYLAAKKYEASPSRADYQEQHKKALEDGILEADAVEAKFKEMRLNK